MAPQQTPQTAFQIALAAGGFAPFPTSAADQSASQRRQQGGEVDEEHVVIPHRRVRDQRVAALQADFNNSNMLGERNADSSSFALSELGVSLEPAQDSESFSEEEMAFKSMHEAQNRQLRRAAMSGSLGGVGSTALPSTMVQSSPFGLVNATHSAPPTYSVPGFLDDNPFCAKELTFEQAEAGLISALSEVAEKCEIWTERIPIHEFRSIVRFKPETIAARFRTLRSVEQFLSHGLTGGNIAGLADSTIDRAIHLLELIVGRLERLASYEGCASVNQGRDHALMAGHLLVTMRAGRRRLVQVGDAVLGSQLRRAIYQDESN